MKRTAKTSEKNYKTSVKILAVILPIIAFIVIIAVLEAIADINSTIKYNQYYACKIVGAESEKQDDGSYIITVEVKNVSSYQTMIDRNSIRVEYGNGTTLENRMVSYPESEILRSINRPVIPSGRTVEYKIQILPPDGINTVRLQYYGTSYGRYKITGEDNESTYSLKLS